MLNNLFNYSAPGNAESDIISLPERLQWDYAFIGVGTQNGGGRINRYIIKNGQENYFLYNAYGEIRKLYIEANNNIIKIIPGTSTVDQREFYIYNITTICISHN